MMRQLVFWHGWAMSPKVWDPLVQALQDRYRGRFACGMPALPGYEGTPLPDQATAGAWVDAMMDQVSEPVTLCAWSMGAIMALDAARRYPEKIEELVLFGATPCFINHRGWTDGLPEETALRFRHGIQKDSPATLRRFIMLFNQHDRHAKDISRQLSALPYPSDEVLLQGLSFLHAVDYRHLVPDIHQKVLLVHGEKDSLMPVSAARWLADTLPDASLTVMPGIAHAPFLSEPDDCAGIIGQFLGWA